MSSRPAEYRLKTSGSKVLHNVLVLNSSSVTLNDFSLPIKLAAQKSASSMEQERREHLSSGLDEDKKPRPFKRKTRIIDTTRRFDNSTPQMYVLEDFDGQHSFVGKIESGQDGKYMFLVNQGNEFRILPVDKWYKFYPNNTTKTLQYDDLRSPIPNDQESDEEDGKPLLPTDEFDISAPGASFILSEAGKQMSRIVRHLDRNNSYLWQDADDPYASDVESASDLDETAPKVSGSQPLSQQRLVDAPPPISSSKIGLKRSMSDLEEPKAASPGDALLTREEVVEVLRHGPIKTRDLIMHFKNKLKGDPRNKDLLREHVRDVAFVAESDEDKLLILKDEFIGKNK